MIHRPACFWVIPSAIDGAALRDRRVWTSRRSSLTGQVDMMEATPLHGLYCVEPPTARTRAAYVVPGVVLETTMFLVLGKMRSGSIYPTGFARHDWNPVVAAPK